MKRLFCLLLAAVLTFGITAAFADDELVSFDDNPGSFLSSPDDELGEDDEEIELVPYDYDHITIGNPTPMNGQFFTDLWGNDTSDIDVRYLVNGYNLITWDSTISVSRFDRSVVSSAVVIDDENGNRSYLMTLYNDLYYSDGTQITAKDYAFSLLLQCSPVIGELGGHPAVLDYIVGYEDYASGNTPYISGVRMPSDNIIIITIKQEALPYFYELSRLSIYPYPIHAIAPGYTVADGGNGVMLYDLEPEVVPAVFNAEELRNTILTPEVGYMTHPDPVSGPYRILSYDGVTAEFEINPYYKGNEAGKKPRIKRLTYTVADNESMIQELGEGRFALLNKVAYETAIQDGMRLTMDQTQYTFSVYPRVGLTYLYFNPNSILVQEQKVRQALAYCLDKTMFISDYVGRYGVPMDGLYGFGQWMYDAATGIMPYPVNLADDATEEEIAAYDEGQLAWDELTFDGITIYELDTEEANRLLDEAGWVLNELGERYDPQKDIVRCKEIDGELRKLELVLGYQPRADVEQAFADYLTVNLAEAGIQLTLEPLEFDYIVEAHNKHSFEGLDVIYFGDNFNISFDPQPFFGDEEAPEDEDSLRSAYQELFALSDDMAHTQPQDILGYMQKWIFLQQRLSELLPVIPVYSNVYFDFYTQELDDYWIEEFQSWAKAIVPARMRTIRSSDDEGIGLEVTSLEDGDLDLSQFRTRTVRDSEEYAEGSLSLFPEYVRKEIPAEYRSIHEFVAAKLDSEIDAEADYIELEYSFQTPYAEDEQVYVLFGIPGKGSDVDWFVQQGVGLEDGSIRVEMEKENWQKLVDITFALAVVSK